MPSSLPRRPRTPASTARAACSTPVRLPHGLWIAVASVALAACSGREGDGASSSSEDIVGGAIDDGADSHPSVVAVRIGSRRAHDVCTGVLLSPRVVLTARHCVSDLVTDRVLCDSEGRSRNGPHVFDAVTASLVAIHTGTRPDFAQPPAARGAHVLTPEGDELCDRDIAAVVLDVPIEGVPILPVRRHAGIAVGERVRSVGYGRDAEGTPTGVRLRRPNVPVLSVGGAAENARTPLGPREFEVGRSICRGDSGGPAISERSGAIVGVVSRGNDCALDYGHVYTQTTGHGDIIEKAFALVGGSPVGEQGDVAPPLAARPPDVASEEPPEESVAAGADEGGCAFGGRIGPSPSPTAALGVFVAALALVSARRRRQ